MKSVKKSSSTHLELLDHVTTPIRNINQNYASDTMSDCSLKSQKKKRKCSTNKPVIATAIDDFNRYLSEKKLHDVGIINLKKYKSNQNIHSSSQFTQFVRIYYNQIMILFFLYRSKI
jgi:hypothetical protein